MYVDTNIIFYAHHIGYHSTSAEGRVSRALEVKVQCGAAPALSKVPSANFGQHAESIAGQDQHSLTGTAA